MTRKPLLVIDPAKLTTEEALALDKAGFDVPGLAARIVSRPLTLGPNPVRNWMEDAR
jgi:hypothetical protein